MALPVVHPDIYHSIEASGYDTEALMDRIASENPEVMRLLKVMMRRGDSITGVLVLYRMLSEQAEANALDDLYYDP